ncbi:MAG: hypothetical protein JWL83_874, partial [Actinomycetia bacterium]|nr:hypothetical protein [Actinomycetes bacterium]
PGGAHPVDGASGSSVKVVQFCGSEAD